MLTSIIKSATPIARQIYLNPELINHQQLRTTFIVKRKYPAPLKTAGRPQKQLRHRYFIYELVKDTEIEKKPDLDLILTHYVQGFGNPGTRISVGQIYGYNKLLLPGLAVYATPENIEKYKYSNVEAKVVYSSPYVQELIAQLSRMVLSVVMNKENPWTLQPWHVKASFRKCGYTVPEDAIMLPPKPINGPDMNLQDREFVVTVAINNTEKADVRCRIHHWTTERKDRMQHIHEFWKETPGSIFPEQEDILNSLPKKGESSKSAN